MSQPTPTLNPTAVREILVAYVGIDAQELDEDPHASLAELGLDSLAQVELAVVLRARHGVEQPPEAIGAMSFDELVNSLCGTPALH
jgi:acyl carrier protein